MRGSTVLVADDHAPIRAGVSAVLQADGFEVCGQAGDAETAVQVALRERPDLCVLDINMPGGGIRAAEEISSALPETPIIMLTVSQKRDDLFAALRAGATGYLLKDSDPARLREAGRAVLSGEAVIPPNLLAHMVEHMRSRPGRRLQLRGGRTIELTGREGEVLELLEDGKTTGEIAFALSVSDVTVRRYVSEIVKKLGVRDREAALRLLEGRSWG
jgi:DNA-binding NarL/FixJ family response regulator